MCNMLPIYSIPAEHVLPWVFKGTKRLRESQTRRRPIDTDRLKDIDLVKRKIHSILSLIDERQESFTSRILPNNSHLHNFAFVCAFLSTGSIFVAYQAIVSGGVFNSGSDR